MSASAWTRPRPDAAALRADALLAIALAFAATTTSLLYFRTTLFTEAPEIWVWILALALCTLPLAVRRIYPVPVAIVVAIGFMISGQFGVPEILIVNICLFLAIYTVGAWEQHRALSVWSRIGITAAMILWLLVTLLISADSTALPGIPRSGIFSAYATFAVLQIITNLMYFGGAFFFGERSWRAARAQAQLAARGRELELERETSAAQAVALDRIGIARELHDVIAHHVSVMGIQAAAARRSLAGDPATARASLELIETSAQSTVEELRGLLHTLRTPEPEANGASTVGIAQLSTLIAATQSAGTPALLIVAGQARPLPMLIDVALYRVVQEALTNVRKHAGRGATAEVRLRYLAEAVEVEIGDTGTRQTLGVSRGSGLGLRGMRERIGAVGGTVTAGRREQGGFIVRATVPLAAMPTHEAAAHRAASATGQEVAGSEVTGSGGAVAGAVAAGDAAPPVKEARA